jgi:hypothetical protein
MLRRSFLAMASAALAAPAAAQTTDVTDVSLIALVANPSAYAGRWVSTIGFLNLEFEGNALYVGKADFDAAISGNSLWVDTQLYRDPAAVKRLARRYVLIEGKVATSKGHLGLHAATITEVRRIEPWPSRAEFQFEGRVGRPSRP